MSGRSAHRVLSYGNADANGTNGKDDMWVIGMVIALAAGIYVGLGMPGVPGRENRVVDSGRRKRLTKHQFLDWLRPTDRDSHSERRRNR